MEQKKALPLAPKHLRPETRRWWRSIVRDWNLESHERALLTAAAETWDRIQEARELIDEQGITVVDRFGQAKPHPALSVERLSRLAFARLVKALALDIEPPPAPRKHPRRH